MDRPPRTSVIQGFDFTIPPALVVHADWSINPGKRWMASAELTGDHYLVQPTELVGDLTNFLNRMVNWAGTGVCVLIGLDYLIDPPYNYAQLTGISNFCSALSVFGKEKLCLDRLVCFKFSAMNDVIQNPRPIIFGKLKAGSLDSHPRRLLYNHYMKPNIHLGGQRVTSLMVKNGSHKPGRHNNVPTPHLAPDRNQSITHSNMPADKCYHLQSSQHIAPTKVRGR